MPQLSLRARSARTQSPRRIHIEQAHLDFGSLEMSRMPSLLVLAAASVAAVYVFWLVFVPPTRLYRSDVNNVRVIRSTFGGLGAIGFFGNRYSLSVLCLLQFP